MEDNKLGGFKTALIGGASFLVATASSAGILHLGGLATKIAFIGASTVFEGLLIYGGYKTIKKQIEKRKNKKNENKELDSDDLGLDEGLTPEQEKENIFGKGVLAAETEQDNAKFFAENRREEKFDKFNAGYDETWKDFHKHIVQSIATKLEDPSLTPDIREQLENIFTDQFRRWQSYDVVNANDFYVNGGHNHFVEDREFTLGDGEQVKTYLDFYVFTRGTEHEAPVVESTPEAIAPEPITPEAEPATDVKAEPRPSVTDEPVVETVAEAPVEPTPPANTPPSASDPWAGRKGFGIPKRDLER
ncbi:MAG: hypothetical protein U0R17_04215 [Acidimicrobiia bacterium]